MFIKDNLRYQRGIMDGAEAFFLSKSDTIYQPTDVRISTKTTKYKMKQNKKNKHPARSSSEKKKEKVKTGYNK